MNDRVRGKLVELLAEHGLGVVREPHRCEELLRLACGEDPKEVFLLTTTLRAGVVTQLLVSNSGGEIEGVIDRVGLILHKSLDIVEESAKWAVASWAVALGLIRSPEKAEPEGSPCRDLTHTAEVAPSEEEAQPNAFEAGEDSQKPPRVHMERRIDEPDEIEQDGPARIVCPNCRTPLLVKVDISDEFDVI
jgi:hypothetical protein